MALTLAECTAVVTELNTLLSNSWIQKIHQPNPLTLTFTLRIPGDTVTLLICADPPLARLHLIDYKLENPPTPPPFCQLLRASLQGGKLIEVVQEPGDRIVYLRILTGSNPFTLVVALTGRQANVHLLNASQTVIQSLRPSQFKPGETFRPSCKPPCSPGAQGLLQQKIPPQPHATGSPPMPVSSLAQRAPVSAELAARYRQQEQERIQAQARQMQRAHLTKALKQAQRKLENLQHDWANVQRYAEYGRYGELLKAHLQSMHKGQDSVTVTDYYDPAMPQLTLPLDPAKDPVQNMEEYFRKYHKFLSAKRQLQPRLEAARQAVAALQEHILAWERGTVAPSPEHVPAPAQDAANEALAPRARSIAPSSRELPQPSPRIKGCRHFISRDGFSILVGKSARDNDELTFHLARPDDLWLHARGVSGSHVVVRVDKKAQVPYETLQDAATLALWFSDLRKSGKGEVMYTLRKFVRKAKGQQPGAVIVSREKSLWVELDDERLARLKEQTKA
ncbi:MAG: fibronectin-binding domain-containing protein [Nitrospirae bacterium]|nr:MAG: fibronectin-binding domain-containing protein [Nitrospirota bacterium]